MNATPNSDNSVRAQLDMHIRAMRNLLAQLDPAERSAVTSELIMHMLPSRNGKPQSTADKLARRNPVFALTAEEQQLIREMDRKTARLFDQLSGKDSI